MKECTKKSQSCFSEAEKKSNKSDLVVDTVDKRFWHCQ